jgi:nucleoside-diphosphate-sugar epimerase
MNKPILVTGATGTIGRDVAKRLFQKGVPKAHRMRRSMPLGKVPSLFRLGSIRYIESGI